MAAATIDQLEGGAALCTWFEGRPSFHDATLRELELRQGAPGRLVAETFRMETQTDGNGYFLLTKHVTVTLTLFDLVEVELFEFMEAGIMFGLDIEHDESGVTLAFESSYGVHGRIKAKRVVVAFEPRHI
jgi:hypothetical protein